MQYEYIYIELKCDRLWTLIKQLWIFLMYANKCICLFACLEYSRIFPSFGEVTIIGKRLQILIMLGTYGHWAVGVPYPATPTVTRDTYTYCQAFGSETVTTCLNELDLSRLEFEHPTFRLRGERFNSLRHRCDLTI